ncbi:MAG: hypothetical protein VYC34_02670 [Planctomycetota bacterium]|nr:hypothetical protein [Planctomycetota bacterium]
MLMKNARAVCVCVGFALAAPALGSGVTMTITDDFESGANLGAWSYFGDPANPIEVMETSGGNADGWLHATCSGTACLDTFAPHLRTQLGVDSAFTGDYRGRDVRSVGVDLRLDYVDFGADGRPLAVVLLSDNGTPGDTTDDFWAYMLGEENVPLVGEGWKSFEFQIDAQSTTLPAGWGILAQGPNSPTNVDAAWNTVMQDVRQLGFFYGDPQNFFIFQQWEPGADNARITEGVACPADINGCGTVDAMDLGILLGSWGPGGGPADISGDGFVNAKDLATLLGSWGACPTSE